MTTKGDFEQQMFDIIATQNPAAAALNCIDVAKEMNKILADQKAELLQIARYFKLACKLILQGDHIDAKFWEKRCEQVIKSVTKNSK